MSLVHFPRRLYSTAVSHNILTDSVMVTVDKRIATVSLSAGSANVLSMKTVSSLRENWAWMEESNSGVDAVILTSSQTGVFSAGLDLKEFYKPEITRVKHYWKNLQLMMAEIYGSRLYTVARMNGHAIAGGCVLAMAADYRIALSESKVGLTEAALGMTLPWWIERMVREQVGSRTCQRWVSLALVEKAAAAERAGFVDEIVTTEEELDAAVSADVARSLLVPQAARAANKIQTRSSLLNGMSISLDKDVEDFGLQITRPELQDAIEKYIQSIKKIKN